MKLETVIKGRVIAAFVIALILITVYVPYVGVPLALLWLGIVVWQYRKQQGESGQNQ